MNNIYKQINLLRKNITRYSNKILYNRHTPSVLIVLILLGGFAVRLYRIENPVADWHSWRQADTASVSRIYVDEGINLAYPKYYDISTTQSGLFNPNGYRFVEFPVYNVIHAVLYNTFPIWSFEVWGRLISIIAATITALILYLLGKKYIGVWGGLAAAFYYAFIPFNVYFTRVILPEPLTVLFGILSIWLMSLFTEKSNLRYLYLSGIAFSLAILIKPYTIFYGLPILWIALQKYSFKNILRNKHFFFALLTATLPLILWRLWESNYPEGIPFTDWVFNKNKIRFRPAFFRWIFGERLGILILGIWGLVPFSFGIVAYKKGKEALTHIFFLSALAYVTIVASANVQHDYYQALIIPSVSLVLALGTVTLWSHKAFNIYITRPLLLFSVFLMLGIGAYSIKGFFNVNHWEIIEAGQAVDKLTPKDALVIAPYNGDTAFLYQTKRFGWPVIDRPLNELIDWGAQYYVSVNYDDVTNKLLNEYEVIEKNERYVILNLGKPL